MIINVHEPREKYFADWDARRILLQFIPKEGNILLSDVCALAEEHRVVVATREGTLDRLLAGEHSADPLGLPNIVKSLQPDKLLILPPAYRIPHREARHAIAYSLDSLVLLDSVDVKRALLGESVLSGPLSAVGKEEAQWDPEKVIGTAFRLLHERREELAGKVLTCYSWWGKDHHRRIVSLYRSIQGAELRAFQNYAAFRLLIPTMRKELREGRDALTGEQLTDEERKEKEKKICRYEQYIRQHHIYEYVRSLNVQFSDLIEPMGGFALQTGHMMRVPSRSQQEQKKYKFNLTDVPLLAPDDPRAYSLVWEMRGKDSCPDKRYHSDRRKREPGRGNPEEFFCAHEIAAALTLRKKAENKEQKVRFLPFVIPTAAMMEYVDALRYRTILLVPNPETGRWTKRALNHTELENLLFRKVLADGYEACFTTDVNKFKERKYDPQLDLVRLRA